MSPLEAGGIHGYWIDLEHVSGAAGLVRKIIEGAENVVGHNLRFDRHKLDRVGISLDGKGLHDTQAMAHLLDEHRPSGLKSLAVSVLEYADTIEVPASRTVNGVKQDYLKPVSREEYEISKAKAWAKREHSLDTIKDIGYHLLPRGTVVPYAIKDAEWTYQLASVLMPQIVSMPDLWTLYCREMDLSNRVLYRLERAGMAVDVGYVDAKIREYAARVETHLQTMEGVVGRPCRVGKGDGEYFNPASPKQVGDWFAERGIPLDSTDAESLRSVDHPLAAALLAFRKDKKILDTYFVALRRETQDGIFHPSIRQHGTVTGRTSSGAAIAD